MTTPGRSPGSRAGSSVGPLFRSAMSRVVAVLLLLGLGAGGYVGHDQMERSIGWAF